MDGAMVGPQSHNLKKYDVVLKTLIFKMVLYHVGLTHQKVQGKCDEYYHTNCHMHSTKIVGA
jgi:hypothetical protein